MLINLHIILGKELQKRNITNSVVANILGISEDEITDKLNGKLSFELHELETLENILFINGPLYELTKHVKNAMQSIMFEGVVNIPNDMILIKKTEYIELKKSENCSVYWTMKDLERETKRKRQWLCENILYVPRFKKELENFVHYPNSKGDTWVFHAKKMSQFLENNFYLIFRSK